MGVTEHVVDIRIVVAILEEVVDILEEIVGSLIVWAIEKVVKVLGEFDYESLRRL